jgi:hypothetical protein
LTGTWKSRIIDTTSTKSENKMKKKFYVHYVDINCDQDGIAIVYAYNIEHAAEEFNFSNIEISYINTESEEMEEV